MAADWQLGARGGPPPAWLFCSPTAFWLFACPLSQCLSPRFSSSLMENTKGKCASAQVWGAPARGMEK